VAKFTVPLQVYETKLLGHNVYGIVIGAQNRETLKVEMFEGADTLAAQEHFGEAKKHGINLTSIL
jgi:hypothetical protein